MIFICKHFLLFIFYSFVGWVLEEVHESIRERKLVNRGFLVGPICPIYGFASIVITNYISRYKEDFIVMFILSVVLCGILEYLTSLLLEKIFKVRWWDYSDMKFNIDGRVTLINLILFGVAASVTNYFVHPHVVSFLESLPNTVIMVLAIIIFIIGFIDTLFSVNIISRVSRTVTKISKRIINRDSTYEIKAKVSKVLKDKIFSRRLFDAFPNFKINFDLIKKIRRRKKKDSD